MIKHIDLTKKSIRDWNPTKHFRESWLGGRGFNSRLLYCFRDSIPAEWDDPGNVIAVGAGMLAGTKFPSSGRTTISVLKSPVSGLFSDGNLGGHFGPALRLAGVDTLVITGALEKPGYLHINKNGHIKIIDIPENMMYWGVGSITIHLQMAHKDKTLKVLAIGQGGANRCFSAVVNCDDRVAGGGGSGAVMGSKNLKAIAVEYDMTQEIPVKHQAGFDIVCEQAEKHIKAHPVYDTFKTYGTTSLVEIHTALKYFPSFNWTMNGFLHWKRISGQAFRKHELEVNPDYMERQEKLADEGKLGCRNCPIVCSNEDKIEYETLNCLGSKVGISDIDTIVFLNSVYFNDGGLDVIETTSVISTLMELSELKIIDFKFEWGDSTAIDKFLGEFICGFKDGVPTLGACFSAGFKAGLFSAEVHGLINIDWARMNDLNPDQIHNGYAGIYNTYYVASKGKAMSGVVPNEKNKGVALAIATSTRGADHLRSLPTLATYASWYIGKGGFKKLIKLLTIPFRAANIMKADAKFLVGDLWKTYEHQFGVPLEYVNTWRMKGFLLDSKKLDGWGGMIKFTQALYAVSDSLSTCRFTSPWRFGIGPKFWSTALLYMGYDRLERQLLNTGHYINTLEKALLYHYGVPIADSVPKRFFKGRGALKESTWKTIYADYCEECGFRGNGKPKSAMVHSILQGDYKDREMINYFESV